MCDKAKNSSAEHAMQASAVAEVPTVNQAAATPMEVRTATDVAEASCLILEEPGLANPEQAKTGPILGLGSANCRGREGTASHIVQVLLLVSSPAYLHDDNHMHSLVYS